MNRLWLIEEACLRGVPRKHATQDDATRRPRLEHQRTLEDTAGAMGDRGSTQRTLHPTDQFGAANRAAYDRLVRALAANNVVAFIGAGVSHSIGYPTWPKFLEQLRSAVLEADPNQQDKLTALENVEDVHHEAGQLKDLLGNAFAPLISTTFGPRTPPFGPLHQHIVRLPLRYLLTTNYDPSIELALRDRFSDLVEPVVVGEGDSWALFLRENSDSPRKYCVYLHGRASNPQSIVLSLDDYRSKYVDILSPRAAIDACFATWSVLFVGWSFTDSAFGVAGELIDRVQRDGEAKHFAFVPFDKGQAAADVRRKHLRARYAVDPIFYHPCNSHSELLTLIERLLEDVLCEPRTPPLVVHAIIREVEQLAELPHALPVRPQLQGIAIRWRSSGRSEAASDSHPTALDREIDTTHTSILAGQPDLAIDKYRKLLAEHSDLPPRLYYRIHANIGNAYLSKGMLSEAADAYLRATDDYLDSKEAGAIRVLGLNLRHAYEEANTLAVAMCAKYPDYARLHAFRLRSEPHDVSFDVLLRSVPQALELDAEVASALASCAMARGLDETAEVWLRKAAEEPPPWSAAISSLADFLLHTVAPQRELEVAPILSPNERARLVEAEQLYTDALAHILPGDPSKIRPALHLNRGLARRLLGKSIEARVDVQQAYAGEPLHPEIAIAEAMLLAEEKAYSEAIACLERLPASSRTGRCNYVLADTLYHRNQGDDRARCFHILWEMIDRMETLESQSERGAVLRFVATREFSPESDARLKARVESIPTSLVPPYLRDEIRARLALALGERSEAGRFLHSAVASATEASEIDILNLSFVAEKLLDWRCALTLLDGIATPSRYDAAARRLLHCAEKGRELLTVVSFCEALRNNGFRIRECYLLEAWAHTECRDPLAAINVLEDWLADHPDDREARLEKSVVAYRFEEPSYAENDPSKLPSVEDVDSPENGAPVAYVLRRGKSPLVGVEYAYQLWRRFPDDKIAAHALIASIFDRTTPPISWPPVAKIDVNCAVELAGQDTPDRVVIIEGGANPSSTRNEYSATHPISRALLGCEVDAAVTIGRDRYKVAKIWPAAFYRAYQCAELDEAHFPDDPVVRKYHVSATASDVEKMFGDGWQDLSSQQTQIEELEQLQQSNSLPVSSLATLLRQPIYETAALHIADPSLVVFMASGDIKERDRAYRIMAGATSVVVDATALATLVQLGLVNVLRKLPFKLLLPRAVLLDFLEGGARWRYTEAEALTLQIRNKRPRLVRYSKEDVQRFIKHRDKVEKELKLRCDLVGGQDLLKLSEQERSEFPRAVGVSAADAIAIAKSRGAVLWSDDGPLRILARTANVQQSVWTQIVINDAWKRGVISNELRIQTIRRLLERRYQFVSITTLDAVEVLKQINWRTDSAAFKAICDQASRVALEGLQNVRVFMGLTLGIWLRCFDRKRSRKAINKLLDCIFRGSPRELVKSVVKNAARGPRDLSRRDFGDYYRLIKAWYRRYRRGAIT